MEFDEETVSFTIYSEEDISDVSASAFRLILDCQELTADELEERELTIDIGEALEDLNITTETPSVKVKLIEE